MVRASTPRIEAALADLQGELLARVPGRRFEAWVRELRALCALLDADGPTPAVSDRDQLYLSETLDGLVVLNGSFVGSTAEEVRQLIEAETDRLARQAQRDAELSLDLVVPPRSVLRARALLELLRRGASGSGGPETHINLDVEAAPVEAPGAGSAGSADPGPDLADAARAADGAAADVRTGRSAGPGPAAAPDAAASLDDAAEASPDVRDPAGSAGHPGLGESSRRWFRRVLGERGDVLAGEARLADGNLLRLLCNPVIHAMVTDTDHEVLQMGRAVRLAKPAQRRALRLRDGGCVFPSCDAPLGWTQVHHSVHWAQGGCTDLALLCLVCTSHHDVSHTSGWQMLPNVDAHGDPNGTFRWISPSGEVLWSQRHGQFVP